MTSTATETPKTSTVRQRLLRGLSSTALNPLVTAIIQLGPVPCLLHFWGAAKYGDWAGLSAIPGYIALSNLGFGDASGSDMTVQVAGGNKQGALASFQSSFALVTATGFLVALLALVSFWFIPWQSWMNLSTLSDGGAASVLVALTIYVLVFQLCGVIESGFRCDGNFATGQTIIIAMRLIEAIVSTALGVLTRSLLGAAVGYLLARSAGTLLFGILLAKRSPWLHFGFKHASVAEVKRLLRPALGFLAVPIASAITIHGFTLLVAHLEGSVAVAAFTTLRTMARVSLQFMNVIAWAMWPEFSRAFGEGNIARARKLHRLSYQAGLVLSASICLTVWFAGPYVYEIWLHHKVAFQPNVFHILVLVTFANSLWFTSSIVPMSTNEHHKIAMALVITSAISLSVGYVVMRHLGLTGAALSLLIVDVSMIGIVLRTSLTQLQDRTTDFLRSLFTPPGALIALLRGRGVQVGSVE